MLRSKTLIERGVAKPTYCTVRPGLTLLHKCKNEACILSKGVVTENKGFAVVSINK